MSLSNDPQIRTLIELAKMEDLGDGDLSSQLLRNPSEIASFDVILNEPGVVAGQDIASAILHHYDKAIELTWSNTYQDGHRITQAPISIAKITGPLGAALTAERVLLNFLQRLTGIATLTRQYVDAVSHTKAHILDTRKTTPGWRSLEKYAVRCGGGMNHRLGLYDAVLIKDNHLADIETARLADAVFQMLNKLSASSVKPTFVEVEADRLDQVEQLLKVVGIDIILLDNFDLQHQADAVKLRDRCGLTGKVALEASGGITLKTVRVVAETGVDRISIGALTHSATAIDLKLERIPC